MNRIEENRRANYFVDCLFRFVLYNWCYDKFLLIYNLQRVPEPKLCGKCTFCLSKDANRCAVVVF